MMVENLTSAMGPAATKVNSLETKIKEHIETFDNTTIDIGQQIIKFKLDYKNNKQNTDIEITIINDKIANEENGIRK